MEREPTEQGGEMVPGANVVGSDGQPLGTLVAIAPTYLIVEQGEATELYVPVDAVAAFDAATVTLNLPRDEAQATSWETAPASFAGFAATEQLAPGIPLAGHVDDLGTTEDDQTEG